MAVLPYDQLYAVMNGAFGDLGPDVVALMTAVAMAESGGNTAAHNNSGEDSRGLGQINIGPGANVDLAGMNLFDPSQNAKAMRIVYDRQGPGAWSVYSNGAYKQFLGQQPQSTPLVQWPAERPNRVSVASPEPQPLVQSAASIPWGDVVSLISPLVRQGGGARGPIASLVDPNLLGGR